MAMLSNVRIVLVETTHPGNIGAAARAMKTMAMDRLYLVRPKIFPHAEATARASGADDLLAKAQVCGDLVQALAGCRLVVGTSARHRAVDWPALWPRQAAEILVAEAALGPVALVFGRESSGLSNEELELCQYLVHIPTQADFNSLNVASAVQILAYECHLASLGEQSGGVADERPLAGADLLDGLHQHLTATLRQIQFAHPQQSEKLLRRLRRLFNRARLDLDEINILRGILTKIQQRVGTPSGQ